MAQYDGSIRINTKISTKDAKVQLSALEHAIVKTADEIKTLRSKMDALKDVGIPTKEFTDLEAELKKAVTEYEKLQAKMEEPGKPTEKYKALQKDLQKAQSELENLAEQQAEMEEMGLPLSPASIKQLADASDRVDAIKEKMNALESKGKAFIPKVDTKELENAKQKVDELKQKIKELKSSGKDFQWGQDTDEYASLARQLSNEKKAIAKMTAQHMALSGFEKLGKIKDSFKKLGETAKRAFSKVDKSAKKSGSSISSFAGRLKGLALSALIFNQISKALNSMVSGMKEGFGNLYNEIGGFKSSIDGLKASALTLKNSLAAAFRPLVEAAIPYIQTAIEYITRLADSFGQLMAAITGQKTYTKAIKQTTAALEEAKEAEEGYLSPLDEINKFQKKDSQSDAGGATGPMFEEVPINSKFLEMANRVKEVMAQLFQPLKTAWESQGQFVMDSWKYALEEIGLLTQSVGKDFLAVWNQPETVSVLENILVIVGDIGLVVGNLAARFREAWEANDVGLRILENIRNLFGIIIEHVRNAADATVEWSKNLDFSPMLESINGLLESLQPLADNIGAGLEWFYTNVLLPIAGWTIEEAIPTFLDMLSAAIGVVNEVIEALKPLGMWLWEEFLQPLGQWAGDTIIAAMETITDLLKKFGNWISENQGLVENFVIIIGSFFAAWKIANFAKDIGVLIAGLVEFISTGGLATAAANLLGGAIAFLTSPIGIATAAIGAIIAIGVLLYKNWDTIKEKAGELKDWLLDKFGTIKDGITKAVEGIRSVVTVIGNNIFNVAKQIIGNTAKAISTVISGVKKVFTGLVDFVSGIFTGNWRKAWEGVTRIFSGVRDTIKGVINGILGFVGSLANGVVNAINTVIRALNRLSFDIPSWIPLIGGNHFGFNIPELSQVPIPRLATGAVIPANKEFLAVLGDQKHGTNIEAPLDTIMQANEKLMLDMISKLGLTDGTGGNDRPIIIKQYLDGKQISEAMIKEGKVRQMATGKNMFMLGLT